MKICLIGYGYWGKILFNNFKSIGYDDITIVDEALNNLNLIDDTFSHYIIATPFSTHKYFLEKICKFKNNILWCENPLVESFDDTIKIYSLLKKIIINYLLIGFILSILV